MRFRDWFPMRNSCPVVGGRGKMVGAYESVAAPPLKSPLDSPPGVLPAFRRSVTPAFFHLGCSQHASQRLLLVLVLLVLLLLLLLLLRLVKRHGKRWSWRSTFQQSGPVLFQTHDAFKVPFRATAPTLGRLQERVNHRLVKWRHGNLASGSRSGILRSDQYCRLVAWLTRWQSTQRRGRRWVPE